MAKQKEAKFVPSEVQGRIIEAPIAAQTLVLAGPGAGKTEVLSRRIAFLIGSGASPSEILVLSFSRNAVKNVMKRVQELSGLTDGVVAQLRHLAVRTFDSWTFRILRLAGHSASDLLRQRHDQNIAALVKLLRGNDRNLVLDRTRHVKHVIVDELQDLNGWRAELVMELLKAHCLKGGEAGFTLLGDPAQAIYNFSLSEDNGDASQYTPQELIADVKEIFAAKLKEETLVGNFRSEQAISRVVEEARAILLGDEAAATKLARLSELVASSPADVPDSDPAMEGGASLAILCRNNGQAFALAETYWGDQDEPPKRMLRLDAGSRSKTTPAWIGALLGRFEAAALTRANFDAIYSHLYGASGAQNEQTPSADDAWQLLMNAAPTSSGSNAVDIEMLRERLGWLDLLPDDEGLAEGEIEVTTIHQSKGLEYDHVKMFESQSEHSVQEIAGMDEIAMQEEANVLFVALSRSGESFSRIEEQYESHLRPLTFAGGVRKRWCNPRARGRGQSWQVEIGLPGDLVSTALVKPGFFSSADDAMETQDWLARNAQDIRGHKVVLVKHLIEGTKSHFDYRIHLQEDGKPGRLLGLTSTQLTYDLAKVGEIYGGGKAKYSLPSRIFNLRISSVSSFSSAGDDLATLYEPWSKSGLWCGITVHGLGWFKPSKRKKT